jgi:hypothetical protein
MNLESIFRDHWRGTWDKLIEQGGIPCHGGSRAANIVQAVHAENSDANSARLFRANAVNNSYVYSGFYQKVGVPASREYLSPQDYARLEKRAGGLCEMCFQPFTATPHIDHNHKTGVVRGLICGGCNLAIGHGKRYELAAVYLAKFGDIATHRPVKELRHGTRYAYNKRKCRCEACRLWQHEHRKSRRILT